MAYLDELCEAFAFTSALGLKVPEWPQSPLSFPDAAVVHRAITEVYEENYLHPEYRVGTCNALSEAVRKRLSDRIGVPLVMTIGSVEYQGSALPVLGEPFNQAAARRLTAGGPGSLCGGPSGYRHHAWLSTYSGEVIDLTLYPSLVTLSPNFLTSTRLRIQPDPLIAYGDRGENGFRHHPTLVGDAFYQTYDKAYPLALAKLAG